VVDYPVSFSLARLCRVYLIKVLFQIASYFSRSIGPLGFGGRVLPAECGGARPQHRASSPAPHPFLAWLAYMRPLGQFAGGRRHGEEALRSARRKATGAAYSDPFGRWPSPSPGEPRSLYPRADQG
jgi:hypothetical protein